MKEALYYTLVVVGCLFCATMFVVLVSLVLPYGFKDDTDMRSAAERIHTLEADVSAIKAQLEREGK